MDRTVPLKRLVDAARPITYGIVQAGEDFLGGVPYIRPTDMTESSGVRDEASLLRTAPEIARNYGRSSVEPGDIVISIGPSYGKLMIVPESLTGANLTQGTARVAPAAEIEGRWLYWALQSRLAREYWDTSVAGGTFSALNLGPLSETPLPVTKGRGEQRRIADFLDEQVTRLGRAIELRESQSARLAEARTSLLASEFGVGSGLVELLTGKSLNSTGWQSRKLSEVLIAAIPGGTPNTDDLSYWAEPAADSYPWLNIADMVEGGRTVTSSKALTRLGLSAARLKPTPPGAILFAMYASVGKTTVLDVPAVWNQAILGLIPGSELLSPYLLHWLELARTVLPVLARSSTQDNLNAQQVKSLRIPMPSLSDQLRLVRRVAAQDETASRLRSVGARHEILLVEQKQALITAAVTGQLDVTTARSGV